MVKDTWYYLWIALFITSYLDLDVSCEEKNLGLKSILLVIAATGAIQFRNEGKYVIYPILIISFMFIKNRRRLFAATLVTAFVVEIVVGIYISNINVAPGSVREMLSVPMQQTAYYTLCYPEDITAEEERVLSEIFAEGTQGNFRMIAELYDPDISDPVKDCFIPYPDEELLRAYFQVWYQQLCRHPKVYVEAFLQHVDGYLLPWKPFVYPKMEGYGYLEGIAWFKMLDGEECVNESINVSFWIKDNGVRKIIEKISILATKCPIIRLLYRPGFYTWLLVGTFLFMFIKNGFRRGIRKGICFLPFFTILLVCMVSPLAGSIRYMLPVMVCMPLLMAWGLMQENSEKEI